MSPENKQPKKIPEIHFRPEGYISGHDEEFLDQLLETLAQHGYSPAELVYSGFEGKNLVKGQAIERYPYVFAMNEAGWRSAIKYGEENPAVYAEGWDVPCIGLYDRHQLAHVYSSDLIDSGDIEELVEGRVELTNIKPGELLGRLPPDAPIEEAVVHRNYPEQSPTDALVGLVFIEDPKRKTYDHGL